jgi:intracellular septation protein
MTKQRHNKFLFFSFIPAIGYWILESNYSIEIAAAGGFLLAILEVSFEKLFLKHIHTVSKFNFVLITGLALMSFMLKEGIWFKLQPFFTGLFMGSFLLWFTLYKKDSLMYEMVKEVQGAKLDKKYLIFLEMWMGYFILSYGLFMAYIALTQETSTWLFFKTGGFYISFIVFYIMINLYYKKKS